MKVVSKKAQPEKQQKLTYEQLNEVCGQLFQRNQQLEARVKALEMENAFKRLDYLFKVLDYPNAFHGDFVGDCRDEIENALTIPKNAENEKEEEKE